MKCKAEELPFLADYARDNFVRDQSDFINNSPEYAEDFLLKYDPQLKLIKEAVATSMLLAQQKAITERIAKHYVSARNWANKIENYAKKASAGLNCRVEDFGFKNLRVDLNNKNDEGTIKKLNEMLQHADVNQPVMEPKGFTIALRNDLRTFIDDFETDIKSQSRKIDERKGLVKENNKEFEILWNMVNNEILETGKVIFKEVNKEKVKDYTYSELIKKIRLARKKDDDEGGTDTPPVK